MFKLLKLVTVFSLLMSLFIFLPSQASADPLNSAFVKQEANKFCGISARVVPLEESQATSSESEDSQEVFNSKNNNDNTALAASSAFSTRVATSSSGSDIVLAGKPGAGYGYCHIYKGHMKNSNGSVYLLGTKHQFKYAEFPAQTMSIAMEVINKASTLGYSGKYRYKQAYSSNAGTTVRVILAPGNSDFANYYYIGYDWVIVTMYPQP